MNSTKQKIIKSAILLFNEKGLTNVRLQHIADDVGISVGNLAYHYYSKKAIIQAIDEELSGLITPIISEQRSFPDLMDFDAQLAYYYHLLMNYSFFFLDLLELKRGYPKLYQKQKNYISQIVQQIENWFNYNVDKGRLRSEIRPNHYKIISHTIWMIITFWMTKPMEYRKPEDSERVFKEVVWSQILPYFTEIGRMEFDLMIERLLDAYSPNEENVSND